MTRQRILITIIWQVIPKIRQVMNDDRPLFRTILNTLYRYYHNASGH